MVVSMVTPVLCREVAIPVLKDSGAWGLVHLVVPVWWGKITSSLMVIMLLRHVAVDRGSLVCLVFLGREPFPARLLNSGGGFRSGCSISVLQIIGLCALGFLTRGGEGGWLEWEVHGYAGQRGKAVCSVVVSRYHHTVGPSTAFGWAGAKAELVDLGSIIMR